MAHTQIRFAMNTPSTPIRFIGGVLGFRCVGVEGRVRDIGNLLDGRVPLAHRVSRGTLLPPI